LDIPLLTAVQLVPLFVERYTPKSIPAKRFVPLTSSEKTHGWLLNPLLTSVQLDPLSVER
jgi:hypothetical protein